MCVKKRAASPSLHAGDGEVGEVWPVADLRGVAADADPLGVRGRGAVEDEHLEPPGRGHLVVRRGRDGARVAVAGELGEERAGVHGVAVRRGRRCRRLQSMPHGAIATLYAPAMSETFMVEVVP